VQSLCGVPEIQELLGLKSRQGVYHIVATDPTFPAPEAVLKSGSVWLTAAVVLWAKGTGREIYTGRTVK